MKSYPRRGGQVRGTVGGSARVQGEVAVANRLRARGDTLAAGSRGGVLAKEKVRPTGRGKDTKRDEGAVRN